MDRLPALAIALALAGCDEGKSNEPVPSRVNAAKTAKGQGTTVESFCDVYATPDKAPAFAWPKLQDSKWPTSATTWRWINVWATWCKPCVEEIPRLVKWRDKLKTFDLAFLSIDQSSDDLADFKAKHPGTPETYRLKDEKAQEAWFAQLGIAAGAPIPVHIFVDAKQRVRCVRAGGVRDQDLAIIEKLLGS
jgi:thiol-disulfide isomerase/thioredoxin